MKSMRSRLLALALALMLMVPAAVVAEDEPQHLTTETSTTIEGTGSTVSTDGSTVSTDGSSVSTGTDTGSNGTDTGSNGTDTGSAGADTGSNGTDTGSNGTDTGSNGTDTDTGSTDTDTGSNGTDTGSAESVCTHDAYSTTSIEVEGTREYSKLNDTQHSVACKVIYNNECQSCGHTWSDGIEYNDSWTEGHSYGADGKVCTLCGYETSCAHSNVNSWESTKDWSYSELDAATHQVSYTAYTYYSCPDCGASWDGDDDRLVTGSNPHSYNENNVCVYCEHVNTCEHPNLGTYEGSKDWSYSDPDAATHLVSYTACTHYSCPDCSASWDGDDDHAVSRRENHYFGSDNICDLCGYEAECTHEGYAGTGVEVEGSRQYSELDAMHHSVACKRVSQYSCPTCGLSWSDGIEYNDSWTEGHSYGTGGQVCTLCGYETSCAHANLTSEEWNKDWNYSEPDETTHLVSYTIYTHYSCPDCSASWDGDDDHAVSRRENHSFGGDNICDLCGYEAECTHEGYTGTDVEVEGSHQYSELDAMQHSVACKRVSQYSCPTCGLSWSDGIEYNDSWTEGHSYGTGGQVCIRCGYETSCAHANLTSWKSRKDSNYSEPNAGTHLLSYTEYTHYSCPDCGASWDGDDDHAVSRRENHYFGSDNICDLCGYEAECTHAGYTSASVEVEGSRNYGESDKTQHTVNNKYIFQCECPTCGLVWTDGEVYDNSWKEVHKFDANGQACTICGYETNCAHPNVKSWESTKDWIYSEPDETTHLATYTAYTHYDCPDCDASWDGDDEHIESDRQNHDYNSDYVCDYCGQPCPHINVSESVTYEAMGDYEPASEQTHSGLAYAVPTYICTDCHKSWTGERPAEMTQFVEKHSFDEEGVCYDCAYQCPHSHVQEWYEKYDTGEYVVAEPSDAGHISTYEALHEYYCRACDSWWEDEAVYVQEFAAHLFENVGTDMVCQRCGYTAPICEHTNRILRDECCEDGSYEAVDALHHSATGTIVREWFCLDCSNTFTETTEGDTITLSHNFDDNRCMRCGYETDCAHENCFVAEEYLYDAGDVVIRKDESGHTYAYAEKRTNYVCNDCGSSWWETTKVVEPTEAHELFGGICLVCGYKPECEHPNVEVEISYELVDPDSYENVGEQGHYMTAIQMTDYYCEQCGTSWTEVSSEKERVLVPHEFHGGVCACGMRVDCDHANIEVEVDYMEGNSKYNQHFQQLNAEEHICTGMVDGYYVCADCGERFIGWFDHIEITENEPHEFVDSKCIWCSYVKPESTPTPEPTATATPKPTATATPEPTATATPEPTATATPEPTATATPEPTATATPEPVYEEVPADEPVYGVKLEDEPEMAEAMLAISTEMEGAGMSIEIVNSEKVLTAEEKGVLDALPVKEQLMTFLSVIGFEEQVNAAMESSGMQLSEGALGLKANIQERIGAMTETERADFEAALLESFPQEVIEIDGEEYVFFIIELEIREGDAVRYERYGFRREGEAWILTRLERAGSAR